MIYVTGDIHGEYWRCNDSYFPEQDEMTKNDYLIICGDFGGIWDPVEGISEKELFHWLENRPFTTLFIDGNHENFDRLYNYPVEEWHGGKVHKISPSVIHLMRGQIFTLDNMKIFTFGGAASHDISGGILAPSDPDFKTKELELRRSEKSCRINHFSWWAQELPTDEEMQEGLNNLAACDNKVDVIITHCCPSSIQKLLDDDKYSTNTLTDYLEQIHQAVEYKKWYFGHYHRNRNMSDKDVLLYRQFLRIS